MTRALFLIASIVLATMSATAQDIRGLEVCTAEKAMDRRTSCLQSNVEFLHQTMDKQRRDLQGKLDAASRETSAQKAEIGALKAELTKLQHELAEVKKSKPAPTSDKK